MTEYHRLDWLSTKHHEAHPAPPIPSWRSLCLPIPSWNSSSAINPFMMFSCSTISVIKFKQRNQSLHDVQSVYQFRHEVHPAQPIPSWRSLSLPILSWVHRAHLIPSWRSLTSPIATNPFMTFTQFTNSVIKFAQSTSPVMMFISGGLSTFVSSKLILSINSVMNFILYINPVVLRRLFLLPYNE